MPLSDKGVLLEKMRENAIAYAKPTAKHIAGTTKLARSEACESLRFSSHAELNIGTSLHQNEFASPIMPAIHGVSSAPPTIAIMSPAAPILCARGSMPPSAIP